MGKGGDNLKEEKAKSEVLINGKLYDITNLKHPGGSIINYYGGDKSNPIDATEAFNNFHKRSKKAQLIMSHLPSREADKNAILKNSLPGQLDLMKDFNDFTVQLEKEGFFKPSVPHVIYRCLEIFVMYGIGFWLLRNEQIILGIILISLAQGRCGWLMHEGGHYSLTGKIAIDRAIQILFYGVGCGMSAGWWRNQHNKHHAMPQKIGHDVDLDTLPLVAFTNKVLGKIKKNSWLQKVWIKLQATLFPVLTTLLVALGWQLYLHPRYIFRTKKPVEAVCLIARYVLWSVLVTSKFGVLQSALLYLAFNWCGANYIFINFAVSHTHLPVVAKDDTQVDWVRYAAIHTMNVSPGPFKFVSWWMSYLNFQIEHHLFPCMPQYRHPIISPRVRALLEKHGLKYDQRSYVEAMKVTFANLHQVGMEVFYG